MAVVPKMKHLRYFGISSYSSRWYHIILWWEIIRIPFNIILAFAGMLSFYVAFVSIPLVYIFIGLLMNFLFCLSWIVELACWRFVKTVGRRKFRLCIMVALLALSLLIIFGFSLALI